ncbi:MAG: hypothetical protein P8O03_03155 [Ilumatobacter sp.]|nr:hypothetical protein [Ilumatobacter sp.]
MQQFTDHADYLDSQAADHHHHDQEHAKPDPITDPHAAIEHAYATGDADTLHRIAGALADAMLGVRR